MMELIERYRTKLSQALAVIFILVFAFSNNALEWTYPAIPGVMMLAGCTLVGIATVGRLWCALYIASEQSEKIIDMSLPPKPMTYAGAASALSLHASTLHRCARGTYCEIKGRCYPMSVFFSRPAASNVALSVAELRARVAELRAEGMTNGAIGRMLGVPERTVAYHSAKLRAPRVR